MIVQHFTFIGDVSEELIDLAMLPLSDHIFSLVMKAQDHCMTAASELDTLKETEFREEVKKVEDLLQEILDDETAQHQPENFTPRVLSLLNRCTAKLKELGAFSYRVTR